MAKILLAEDETDIRELLLFTLKYAGHDVTAHGNGAEVVDSVGTVNPDLILLDVRMPRMTGYEACKVIKSNPQTRHIPVVFLTAKGQEEEVQSGMEAGADDYILKPFAPDYLIKRVSEILQRSAERKPKETPPVAAAPAGAKPDPEGQKPADAEPPAPAGGPAPGV